MEKSLYAPTYLMHLCEQYRLKPSKSKGQNYLVNKGVIQDIVKHAEVNKDDTVLEVGPGFGVLTEALSTHAKNVTAFEIEETLRPYWEDRAKELQNLEIIWGDALQTLPKYTHELKQKNSSYKFIANLPYQISSVMMRTILELEHQPTYLLVMLQKEVVQHICEKPGNMSLLSVAVQIYGTPKLIKTVKKGSFWPVPKVDSALLEISNISQPAESKNILKLAKAGFSQKRKQLWKNIHTELGIEPEVIKKALKDVCGNEKIRAQELSVGQWTELQKHI